MVKLKGVMYTTKELINNTHDLEKLNRKAAYYGVFFGQISINTVYTTEQGFNFFTSDAMTERVPIRTEYVIKILLHDASLYNKDYIQLNMDEVLVLLEGGRHIILNENDIKQEKVLEIE